MTTEELLQLLNAQHKTSLEAFAKNTTAMDSLSARMLSVEQALASRTFSGGGGGRRDSWGQQVVRSDRLKAFLANGLSGQVRVSFKAEITTPSGTDPADLVAPDRQPIQGLPQQQLTVRNLMTAVPTNSNKIDFVRQVSRTNAAAVVADGAEKPESTYEFELAEAPVRTIAHWVPATRQTFEDVDGLAALIDNELRFGVRLAEEQEILAGDGTGQHIQGLIPQAQVYSPPFEVAQENALDRLLLAIVQAQRARLPVDGVVINDVTWAQLISLKDSEGRYLAGAGGGPFGTIPGLIWQVKVLPTPTMERGEALVGSFRLGARLHDRMDVEVLVSTEDRDNFIKNMVTVRAEERTALAVRVPDAFVYIDELGEGFSG